MHANPTRKKLVLRSLSLAFVLALPLGVRAADEHEHTGTEENSPLHVAMEKIGKTYRTLGRALRAPDPAAKATYLEQIQTIEALAVEAKAYTPSSIAELPEAERPAKLAAYRADLATAIETMLQLERAILADDWENVKTLSQKLGTERNEGHKKYNPEKPKPTQPAPPAKP